MNPILRLAFSPKHLQRSLSLGMKSLWLHKLRSMLTALGIVFGVASVIAMLSIGEGASYEAQRQIRQLGSQNIIVQSVKPSDTDSKGAGGKRSFVAEYGLTHRDLLQIARTIPNISLTIPNRISKDYVWFLTRRVDSELIGTIAEYPRMRNRALLEGRFFTDLEMENRVNVAIIDQQTAEKLFPLEPPVGQAIRVKSTYFRVIGVLENDGKSEASGGAAAIASQVFVPLTTLMEYYGDILFKARSGSFEAEKVELHEITIRAEESENVEEIAAAVRYVVAENHPKNDYRVVVPIELLRQAEKTKRMFNIVLGSIAAISLLVGGIGIMNIMLASVTERTREIGIRRALGARRADIILQFLIETVLLSGVGGVLGVLIGLGVPLLITHFTEMATITRIWAPTLAFTISVMTGMIFGIYPAIKAAEMNPVEALRHE